MYLLGIGIGIGIAENAENTYSVFYTHIVSQSKAHMFTTKYNKLTVASVSAFC